MPYSWQYFVLVVLQAAVIPLVRDPGLLPRLRRHPLVGLLPLAGIGGMVIVLGAVPAAVGWVTTLAAFAVPPLALLAALHARRAVVPLALAAPLLWLVAWRADGRWADLAGDLLIVLAAVTLGRLTGWVAPRAALIVGVFAATIVDVWQVANVEVQPVAQALAAATPPRGLPGLQELAMGGASMGWGDAYLAAVVGAIVAASGRATAVAAIATLVAGALLGLLFGVLDYVPATVPVACGLIAAGVAERARVGVWVRTAIEGRRRPTMPPDKEA